MPDLVLQIQQLSTKEVARITGNSSGPPGSAGQSVEVRGQWATSQTYVYRDIVYNNGSSYICKVSHSSNSLNEPGVGAQSAAFWEGFADSSINDATTDTDTTWSSSKISTELSGKAASSHNHAASNITSGTLANARISQSSVTQHQNAIDHDQLLNFSADEHRTINDSGGGVTDLWSANKITSELATKANTSHNHAASNITSGTLADARVAQSNVTQHQGAIDHGSIGGLDDNDHTAYITNSIIGSMFPVPAEPYGVPEQNSIEAASKASGFLKMTRVASGTMPTKIPIEYFSMYDGSTLLGGWIDSNGGTIGEGPSGPFAPSGNYWYWNDLFVLGNESQMWLQDAGKIRFYESEANGTYYLSISAPDTLGGLYDYRLPAPPTQEGMSLTVGTSGPTNGVMRWEPQAGDAFPTTNLYNGRMFYRTDLGEMFYYDDGTDFGSPIVARWISVETVLFDFGRNVVTSIPGNIPLNAPGNASFARDGAGFYLNYDYFLVDATVTSAQSITGSATIHRNATEVKVLNLTSESIQTMGRAKSGWVVLDSGGSVWADADLSSGTIDDPIVLIYLKKFIAA